jgi:hypothetical protein
MLEGLIIEWCRTFEDAAGAVKQARQSVRD